MSKANLKTATHLLNQEYLAAKQSSPQFITQPMSTTNIYDAISESGAFESRSKIESAESKTQLQFETKKQLEFQKSLELVSEDKIDSLSNRDRQQHKIIEIATSLTREIEPERNGIEVSTNTIGSFQIWRDQNDIAIVDLDQNQVVAYGSSSQDFFTTIVKDQKLSEPSQSPRLLDQVTQSNAGIKTQYDSQIIDKAYQKFKPLDPVFQALNSQESKPRVDISKQALNSARKWIGKLDQHLKKSSEKAINLSSEFLLNIKDRANNVAAKVLSERLAQKTLSTFNTAHGRTGENKYTLGDYTIEKREDSNNIKLLDQDKKVLVSFDINTQERSKPQVRSYFQDPKELHKTANILDRSQTLAIGSESKEKEYKSLVFQTITQLSKYKNGTSQLPGSSSSLFKNNNSIVVRDSNGNQKLIADRDRNYSSLSKQELSDLRTAINEDFLKKRQQDQVETIAPTLKQYLDINGENRIEKDNFVVTFDPQSRQVSYRDKNDKAEFLRANLTKTGWKNIETNLSPNKEEYFQEVARKIDGYVHKQNLVSQSKRGMRK